MGVAAHGEGDAQRRESDQLGCTVGTGAAHQGVDQSGIESHQQACGQGCSPSSGGPNIVLRPVPRRGECQRCDDTSHHEARSEERAE